MKRPGSNLVKPRKRKWRRRAWWALGALFLAALAAPFVFTGTLLRFYLAHSDYRNLPVRFRAAALSPTGRLTVFDLEIDDTGDFAGRRLLFAEQAAISFNWLDVSSYHVQSIQLEKLELWLHPGTDTPLTLLRLADVGGGVAAPSGAPVTTGTAGSANPFVCDEWIASGHVRFADYDPWMALVQVRNNDPLPVHLVMHTTGPAALPRREVSLLLGDADTPARPFLTGVFTLQTTADGVLLNVDRLQAANLSPAAAPAVLQAWPGLAGVLEPGGVAHGGVAPGGGAGGHFERLMLSGTLSVGRDVTINASAELRDLSARIPEVGRAGELSVEHLSAATHVEGKITSTPLKDLKFSRSRCSWDLAQLGDWKTQRGVADLQVEGTELVLSDLQAECADVPLVATAALDLSTGVLTRGRLWTASVPAQRLRERLPAALGRKIPEALAGNLKARVFLNDSDRDHVTAYVEVVCPEGLTWNVPGPATSAATRPEGAWSGAAWPGAVLSNGLLSGILTWNLRPDSPPEVSHGRLTAEQLLLIAPPARGREGGGTAFNLVKADFNVSGNMVRLDDFYADLPGNGHLSLEGNFIPADGSFEALVLSLTGIDLELANPWLPAGWTLTGQLETECHGGISPRAAALDASLGLASQTVISGPGGKLTVVGAPPVVAVRLATDRHTGITQIQTSEISRVDAIQADAGFVRLLRNLVAPARGSAAAGWFDQMGDGGYVSFDKLGLAGHVSLTEAGGTFNCIGLDIGTGNEAGTAARPPSLLNLALRADIAAALQPGYVPDPATLRISGGQFLAQNITLGPTVFSEISGNFSADKGKAYLTRGALMVADGTVEGDAAVGFDGALEALHLGFTGLHQQALWRNFYPDVFTAEGAISGKLALLRAADGRLGGSVELLADQPGRLRISRQTSQSTFAQVAKAAMQSEDTVLPANFDEIVLDQLADYPYSTGKASLTEDASGLHLMLDYARQPLQEGDPGYGVPVTLKVGAAGGGDQKVKANLVFQLRGGSVTLHQSVVDLLERYLGIGGS